MRHLFVLFLLTVCSTAWSQPTEKAVLCYELAEVVKILKEDYAEQTIFTDRNTMSKGSWIALAENPETGTWTLFEYDSKTACILAMGQRKPAQRL